MPDGTPLDAEDSTVPKAFSELVTADHLILANEDEHSRHGDAVSLVIQDRATRWIESHPNATKSAPDTLYAFKQFVRADTDVQRLYSDVSKEIASAAKSMGWRHDSSTRTDHRPMVWRNERSSE